MAAQYPGQTANDLTEAEKQSVSALSTLAAGLVSGLAGNSTASAASGAQSGRNAVENNFLSSDMYALNRKVKAAREKGEDIAPILEEVRKQAEKDREKQAASCQDHPDMCAFGRDVANDAYSSYLENGFLLGIDSDVARFVQQETAKDNAVIDRYASEFGKDLAVASEGEALLAGAGVSAVLPGKAGGSARDAKLSQSEINEIVNTPKAPQSSQIIKSYGPYEVGPLGNPNDLRAPASTFRSGSYTEKVAERDVYLYRDYGGDAKVDGRYWTPEPSKGPLQSQLDSAVLPEWGNTFQNKAIIKIPKGTKYYEGPAAVQTGTKETYTTLHGGGTQIFLPNPKTEWNIKK
ncbi:VENN motif pre-toxin domain-containing protein [Pectobacterium aroidearum]